MATKIVDKILPTTMVGSYPRPHWYKHQLLGRDIRIAFKEVQYEEAYQDAVACCAPFRAELRIQRADGEYRWVESLGLPHMSASGEFAFHAGIAELGKP